MTLTKARTEANKAFKMAKDAVALGTVSPGSVSGGLIAAFRDIIRQLEDKDKAPFQNWCDRKWDAFGKELGVALSRRGA
ncbi:MAG: hypothetical protein WCC00_00680 [Candidatus Aminicenantales bacterium]|jgi:hypothetical protein